MDVTPNLFFSIGAETELKIHDGTVRELIFIESSATSATLVSGGAGDCAICLTDCASGGTTRLSGHTAPILGLCAWTPVTDAIAGFVSCSADKSIRLWDVRASSAVRTILPSETPGLFPTIELIE